MACQPGEINTYFSLSGKRPCGTAEAVQRLLEVSDELTAAATPLGGSQTAKAWAVQHILQSCKKRGEKLVIFCQYLTDLDEIEIALKKVFAESFAAAQIVYEPQGCTSCDNGHCVFRVPPSCMYKG